MDIRDYGKDICLTKTDIIELYRYFGGYGYTYNEMKYTTQNEAFNQNKEKQSCNMDTYVELINKLTLKDANDKFNTLMANITNSFDFNDEQIKELNNRKSDMLKYIKHSKEFEDNLYNWISNQKVEIIYHIFNTMNIKHELFKALKNIKPQNQNGFESANQQLDKRIRFILKTNCPYKFLADKDKTKYKYLERLSKSTKGSKLLDELEKIVIKQNKEDFEMFNFISISDDNNIQTIDNQFHMEPHELVANLTNDIIEYTNLNQYFEAKEIVDIKNEVQKSALINFGATIEISYNSNYQIGIYERQLNGLNLSEEQKNDLSLKYFEYDLLHINIIIENFQNAIRSRYINKINNNLPKHSKRIIVVDSDYTECLLTTKIAKINLQLVHYKFLFNNINKLNGRILYLMFNNNSEVEISKDIYRLSKLAKYNNNLEYIKNGKPLSKYYNALLAKYFSNKQKNENGINTSNSENFDQFIKELKSSE